MEICLGSSRHLIDHFNDIDVVSETHTNAKRSENTQPEYLRFEKERDERNEPEYDIRKDLHIYKTRFGKILRSVYEDQVFGRT